VARLPVRLRPRTLISINQDNDACLLTGEVAFQAASMMMGEAFKLIRVMEKHIQLLQKECYSHEQGLKGG
jgi:hypothetical protein